MNFAIKNFNISNSSISVALFWRKEPKFRIYSIDISSLDAKSFADKIKMGNSGYVLKSSSETNRFFTRICLCLKGRKQVISMEGVFLERLTPFQKKILCTLCKKVPRGRTVSYSGLAKLAGCPGAARAVGSVMSSNPFPLVFPCHRVVRNDGSIGCFQGGKQGIPLKEKLLKLEKIVTEN